MDKDPIPSFLEASQKVHIFLGSKTEGNGDGDKERYLDLCWEGCFTREESDKDVAAGP